MLAAFVFPAGFQHFPWWRLAVIARSIDGPLFEPGGIVTGCNAEPLCAGFVNTWSWNHVDIYY